jgi:hypothetical protein
MKVVLVWQSQVGVELKARPRCTAKHTDGVPLWEELHCYPLAVRLTVLSTVHRVLVSLHAGLLVAAAGNIWRQAQRIEGGLALWLDKSSRRVEDGVLQDVEIEINDLGVLVCLL